MSCRRRAGIGGRPGRRGDLRSVVGRYRPRSARLTSLFFRPLRPPRFIRIVDEPGQLADEAGNSLSEPGYRLPETGEISLMVDNFSLEDTNKCCQDNDGHPRRVDGAHDERDAEQEGNDGRVFPELNQSAEPVVQHGTLRRRGKAASTQKCTLKAHYMQSAQTDRFD